MRSTACKGLTCHFPFRRRGQVRWEHSLGLPLLCIFLIAVPTFSTPGTDDKRTEIRANGEVLDTSTIASLQPSGMLSPSWMVGILGSITGLVSPKRLDIKQWYVVTDGTVRIEELARSSGVVFGMPVADKTYAVTGSEDMARRLAGTGGVDWVNERPKTHRIDKGIRAILSGSRRAEGGDLSNEDGAMQLKNLLVLLLPASQQHISSRISALDFKALCDVEFGKKGWKVEVTAINENKLLVEVRGSEHGGAGRTPTSQVVNWLTDQCQVQWVEPKTMYKPSARHSSKMMTLSDFGNRYGSDAAQETLTASLTSSVQTALWEVESRGGERSGRFCFWHNDRMFVGQNGTDLTFLSPMSTVTARVAGTGYTTNAGQMVTTLHVNSSHALSAEEDWYAGMQVQIGTDFRMISSYQPSTATMTVHPAIEGPLEAGTEMQIWPVVQPGDEVVVMADADMWRGSVRQEWLPREQVSGVDPNQRIHVQCPMENAPPMRDRIPTMLWDWGIRALRESCRAMESQQATVRITSEADLTDENAPEECTALCRSETARERLEQERVCVYNLTMVMYSGQFGQPQEGDPWWCECTYDAPIPWMLRLTIPQANPLWEAGLSGGGQVVALADTGVDASNCLLSEEEGHVPPPEAMVDMQRDKVVGVLRNSDCRLCGGCSKLISEDRWTFFGSDAELSPPTPANPGRPIWSFAWPHRCENVQTRSPAGCDVEGQDSELEPRRYSQLGARLEMGLSVSLPPPFETVPGQVKVYVLAREDYEQYRSNVTALDLHRHLCLNEGCGQAVENLEFSGANALNLRPSRRGYGIVIAVSGDNSVKVSNRLSDGATGIQFSSAELPCGDFNDDHNGHGTFCAGVIAGQLAGGVAGGGDVGTRAERTAASNHQGIAKDAQLLMFDLSSGVDGVDNLTVPLDLEGGMLKPVWEAGARIMSNSWSCYFPQILCDVSECQYTQEDYCNSYSSASFELDHFVWEHPDMLLVVPVGDSVTPDGKASTGSLRAPATCKNCISVGSSHLWHQTLEDAMDNVNAMDWTSSPLEGKRAMCPRRLYPEPERWPQNLGVSASSGQDGSEALLDGEIAGWPVAPADCCNTDPNHNTDIEVLVAAYQEQIDFNVEEGRQATADQFALLQDAEKAKLYPCRPEPNCCLVQDAFCCLDNYRGPDAAASTPNSLRPTRFDINSVVATSARGPVNDDFGAETAEFARVKPDMVAPGAFLVAANSQGVMPPEPHCGLPPRTDEPFDESAAVVAMSGTSVATAVIAGSAAIVRQYFSDGWHPTGAPRDEDKLQVSAALIKACLLTSSRSVTHDGGSSARVSQLPNVAEGWGRPSLMRLLYVKNSGLENRRLWVVDETIGFEVQGWVHEYEFLVDMSAERVELAITMTWTDPAATPGNDLVLVNDLDLSASDEGSVGWVNARVCDIDPFTETFIEDCPKPIPDRDNTVEKSDFWIQHKQVCTYGKGSRLEYGGCFREGELGQLRSQTKDRAPSKVKVRVIAHRVTEECTSDGFYQTCAPRRQPYALVVSGPLLTRESDGSLVPPVMSSYRVGSAPPKDVDGPVAPVTRSGNGTSSAASKPAVSPLWTTCLLLAAALGAHSRCV